MSNLSLSPNYLTGLDLWPWKVPCCPASLPGRWVSLVYAFRWYFWSKVWHSKTYYADQRIMGNRKWSRTFEVCFPRGIYNIFSKCDPYTQLSAGGRKNIDGLCACLGSWRGPSQTPRIRHSWSRRLSQLGKGHHKIAVYLTIHDSILSEFQTPLPATIPRYILQRPLDKSDTQSCLIYDITRGNSLDW